MFTKTENLIAISTDAKTKKGLKKGVMTGIMYLAPHSISGYQVCPKSSPLCRAACLYSAGMGRYTNVQKGRINKTLWFFEERESFMKTLVKNVERLIKKAHKANMMAAVRLNGTSDIAWEKITCERNGNTYRNIMEAFPDVQFYDYTKILGRKTALSLPNYHLTFSLSENNDHEAIEALNQGYNVAVVIDIKKNEPKPMYWGGYPAIDGDETDIRFRDPKGGHIVLLTAKGEAKKKGVADGFVRKVDEGFRNVLQLAA